MDRPAWAEVRKAVKKYYGTAGGEHESADDLAADCLLLWTSLLMGKKAVKTGNQGGLARRYKTDQGEWQIICLGAPFMKYWRTCIRNLMTSKGRARDSRDLTNMEVRKTDKLTGETERDEDGNLIMIPLRGRTEPPLSVDDDDDEPDLPDDFALDVETRTEARRLIPKTKPKEAKPMTADERRARIALLQRRTGEWKDFFGR